MSILPDPIDTMSDAEVQHMVETAYSTAMADHADWMRCRTEFGAKSPEAKVAYESYSASEEFWRELRDKADKRKAA